MKILLTGAAGFIGMHTTLRLLARGDEVIGVDNLNDYYDVNLKLARLARLEPHPNFRLHRLSVEDRDGMAKLFQQEKPQRVVHLAAQAGVRYSLTNPHAYIDANIQGFMNVLEGCRHAGVEHLAYASSSSVYGGNTALPFSEHHNIDHPVSLYAATKKANELMAHTYSHLFRIPTTGLRFFTVYGPWGRPDMALFLFTKAILDGKAIDVFNNGQMVRDFTYIDDIVEGVIRVLDKPATAADSFDAATPDPATANAPYRVFNIGNNRPTPLMDYIGALEKAIGREAQKNFLPMQPGDVPATSADTAELDAWVGFKPDTRVEVGVQRFYDWYRAHYRGR
ncbi:MAG: putative nucleotide sugar epimerase [Ramlibacter sp.]|uniref:NAD-dependent epimerase n=1 Tax=Ramlibacter sp. TaxID=1917967 RepID=UPI00262930FE|nr:NAD-dependent epimerase [Ramlibacter sp.]MDB5751238.1 putative nucleotide sugar epimerase [Ramlibacter sp.]